MKRILVATDFSTRSDRALRRAILLAKQHGGPLDLVHVVDDDQPPRILEAERSAAEALLDETARTVRAVDGIACEATVALGDPFEGIVRTSEECGADLVVIGPHRRHALRDVFVGTTAERSIRQGTRPTLMANAVPAGPYRRVLVAVDLSERSREAALAVTALGLDRDAAVVMVHVFDAPGVDYMSRAALRTDEVDRYLGGQEDDARRHFAAFVGGLPVPPSQAILKRAAPTPAATIAAVADDIAADLLVLGTHGRGGVAKFLLGSVVEEVLRMAGRDVLAIPPPRGR